MFAPPISRRVHEPVVKIVKVQITKWELVYAIHVQMLRALLLTNGGKASVITVEGC